MEKILVVDAPYARHLNLKSQTICLFPEHKEECPWLIPQEQYSKLTTEIIQASNELSKVFVREYFSKYLNYKDESLECLFNGFGGLFCFLIADRLVRINKLMKATGQTRFRLPVVEFKYDTSWTHTHIFYNMIEQSPEFNQWILNTLFSDWPRTGDDDCLTGIESQALYFENFLPDDERKRRSRRLLDRVVGQVWNSSAVGLRKLRVFNAGRRIQAKLRESVVAWARVFRYWISSLGADIAWDGVGPIPDPAYDRWEMMWPVGRLCFRGQDFIAGYSGTGSGRVPRAELRCLKSQMAFAFQKICQEMDGECLIPLKNFERIVDLFEVTMPRCFVEDVDIHARKALSLLRSFNGGTYFCGFTFSGFSSAFRMFACRELNIEVISTQHSAWGGYFANGPLVTEFLIKGSDRYVTFGWDHPPVDGSSWRKSAIQMSAPLTSLMYQERKKFQPKGFHRRVLLCPGFIYRFPSIYNSALRVDNIRHWSEIMKDVVSELCRAEIQVDILMYNQVMAGNMRDCLGDWLLGHEEWAREYPDHDVKVRYILGSDEFREKYDAVVWDLMAGGFVESVASDIPTFALWSPELHLATKEGIPVIKDLQNEGVLFSSGAELVHHLGRFYQNPQRLLLDQNPALQLFFKSFVAIKEEWFEEWNQFFKSLKSS